jgi:Fic family protein
VKLPAPPPDLSALLAITLKSPERGQRLAELLGRHGPAPGGKYRHWDTFRHAVDPAAGTPEEQWLAVKLSRQALYTELPLADAQGRPFVYALPNPALELLHRVDRSAGGPLKVSDQVTNPATRDTYLFKSIVEEAITSSQLEGASTTRIAAKAMIQEGRPPRTRGERMIVNNYEAMRFVLRSVDQPLTPQLVFQVQRILTEGTLDEPTGAGRFRTADEDIVIEDETGVRLHTPPPANQLPDRMQAMCDFANAQDDGEFMPPAVRAILLHFWLAHDHPFVDGNGRTARALFYRSMARADYWLCEYVSISRILRKARAQYARAYLYTESDDNDTTYFLLYQLKVLLIAIDELHHFLARKAREIHEAEELVRRTSLVRSALNPRQLALINHALKTPDARYTVQSHRKSHGVSYETARSDLHDLVGERLLGQRRSGHAFVFSPVKDLRRKLKADL